MTHSSTEIFTRNWRIYQQITANNYMFHHDFERQLMPVFKQVTAEDKPVDVLDCGCGDAWLLSRKLTGKNVKSFTGYDMSEQALSFAKQNLERLNCEIYLKQGPMEESIKTEQKKFDLIYSSFSIHHLQDSDKKAFLVDLKRHLKRDAMLVIIDILRDKALSREEYLEEYIGHIGKTWTNISSEDQTLILIICGTTISRLLILNSLSG